MERRIAGEFKDFDGLAEVEFLSSSDEGQRPARTKIWRVYKGNIAPNTVINLYTVAGSVCGPGVLPKGYRGLAFLRRVDPDLPGLKSRWRIHRFVGQNDFKRLRQLGLLNAIRR